MVTSISSQATNHILKKPQQYLFFTAIANTVTVTDMAYRTQNTSSQLKRLAGLALLAMEPLITYCIMDAFADLLGAIKENAEFTRNSINLAA